MEDKEKEKGRVCVTGGTGFIASCLIMRLLHSGYSVNTTVRNHPDGERDLSYLTNLPGASEKLKIFNADLDEPDSFAPAINGCVGVFHVVHPMGGDESDSETTKTKRIIGGLLGLLKACIESTTVKRFVHTSSTTAVVFDGKDSAVRDEESWTDVDLIRSSGVQLNSYVTTKTVAEKTALEFGRKHGLDVISLVPTWVNGPFFTPTCPKSVRVSLSLIFGDEDYYKFIVNTSLVHVDDVARAYVHLFECPNVEGRYICSAVEITGDELSQFLSLRYPEFQLPTADSLKGVTPVKICGFSSKKLLETGFKYEYGLEEMFEGAIQSCKEKGLL